ncbi:hypothetical protein DNTS_022067 [Danionella cerebrum]|uniref:Interleukin 34 n=1 Tax=Danionella cerebrum TaxID=2873325 RepID=A0A553PYU8_9TELE|nr:hypothetical protein DNTS_022067 [Danionella translucida]
MVQFENWLLRGLLGFVCLLPVCSSAEQDLCGPLTTVREKLNATQRRRFMKMYFPINYTIQVHYEEVFKLRNISRLLNTSTEHEPVLVKDLQDLWLSVTLQGIKRVLRVLPDRHPTRRKYLQDLENLFRHFEGVYHFNQKEQRELPESIQNIMDRITDQNYHGWKSVTPKSILDNSYRTMHCLFKECFRKDNYDYCEVPKKKTT